MAFSRRFVLLVVLCAAFASPAFADYGSAKQAFEIGDHATAFAEFRALAEEGDPRAQFALGLMFQTGRGTDRDHGKALHWYRAAADQGLARAQSNLGVLYRRGLGVERDFTQALKWFRKAADQGYARAEYNLAEMYRNGEGVTRDLVQAYVWYEFPLTNLPPSGRAAAALRRNAMIDSMSVSELVEAERLARAHRARREPGAVFPGETAEKVQRAQGVRRIETPVETAVVSGPVER